MTANLEIESMNIHPPNQGYRNEQMTIKSITLPVALRLNTQSFSGLEDFFVIIRVFDKYFKTKVDAKDIEDAEQIIEKTIIGFEYQIMNIYKANE